MSLKIKKMLVAFAFVLSIPFVCAGTCDESAPSTPSTSQTTVISSNTGGDWRRCDSLTCTYKKDGDVRTGIKGVRINLATAVPLGGNWE